MVRKIWKKYKNRLAVFLLIAVVSCSCFIMPASALIVGDSQTDDYVSSFETQYGYLAIPFDRITLKTSGFGMYSEEFPLYSISLNGDTNANTNISDPDDIFRDVSYYTQLFNKIDNNTADVFAFISGRIATDGVFSFDLSTSKPFIFSYNDYTDFYNVSHINVAAGYELKETFTMNVSYPVLIHAGGYELRNETVTLVRTFNNTSSNTVSVILMPFPNSAEVSFWDDVGTKQFIVNSCTLSIDLANYSADDTKYSYNLGCGLSLRYRDESQLPSFKQFYENYPGHRVIVSDDPDASTFDVLTFLKNGVGGFFNTEIMPGVSFGGLLSVAIGISLVFLFLKFFAGG